MVEDIIKGGPILILALALLGLIAVAYKTLPPLLTDYLEKRKEKRNGTSISDTALDTSRSFRSSASEAWVARMEARAQEIHDAKAQLHQFGQRLDRAERHIANLMGYWSDMRNKHEELRVQVAEVAGDVKEVKAKLDAGEQRMERMEDTMTNVDRKIDRIVERFVPSTPEPRRA